MVDSTAHNETPEPQHPAEEPVNPPQAETAPEGEAESPDLPAELIAPDHTLTDVRHTEMTPEAGTPLSVEETTPAGEPVAGVETVHAEESPPAEESAAETPVEPVAPAAKKPARGGKKKTKAEAKEPEAEGDGQPAAEAEPVPAETPDDNKKWYVVKVQSGREESIKEAIERRVKIEGLEEYFGEILIPVEKEKVLHKGKRVERERKLYPGYIMARVEFNDQILYLFRETSGVGDFVGGGPGQKPLPMTQIEIDRMRGVRPEPIRGKTTTTGTAPYSLGERVRVKEGVFSGMEGDIKEVLEAKEQVRIELFVLGRPVSVELDYWQVELV